MLGEDGRCEQCRRHEGVESKEGQVHDGGDATSCDDAKRRESKADKERISQPRCDQQHIRYDMDCWNEVAERCSLRLTNLGSDDD